MLNTCLRLRNLGSKTFPHKLCLYVSTNTHNKVIHKPASSITHLVTVYIQYLKDVLSSRTLCNCMYSSCCVVIHRTMLKCNCNTLHRYHTPGVYRGVLTEYWIVSIVHHPMGYWPTQELREIYMLPRFFCLFIINIMRWFIGKVINDYSTVQACSSMCVVHTDLSWQYNNRVTRKSEPKNEKVISKKPYVSC